MRAREGMSDIFLPCVVSFERCATSGTLQPRSSLETAAAKRRCTPDNVVAWEYDSNARRPAVSSSTSTSQEIEAALVTLGVPSTLGTTRLSRRLRSGVLTSSDITSDVTKFMTGSGDGVSVGDGVRCTTVVIFVLVVGLGGAGGAGGEGTGGNGRCARSVESRTQSIACMTEDICLSRESFISASSRSRLVRLRSLLGGRARRRSGKANPVLLAVAGLMPVGRGGSECERCLLGSAIESIPCAVCSGSGEGAPFASSCPLFSPIAMCPVGVKIKGKGE